MNNLKNIPLTAVITQLKKDLVEAQAQAMKDCDEENFLFVDDIEVEFQVAATMSGELDARGEKKVELSIFDWVKLGEVTLEGGVKGSLQHATTQKVKLKLSAATLDKETKKLRKMQVSSETEIE